VTEGLFIQMTGMSGSGKTTLAQAVASKLRARGLLVEIIDGDEYRSNLCEDLGFSKEDRNTNIRRLGFVGRVLARNLVISIMSAINPYEKVRNELTEASDRTRLVYVKCSLPTLKARDPKGLYRRAFLPEDHPEHIPNFTGVSDPFEEPSRPDLTINTDQHDLQQSVEIFENFILENIKG
jgi:adenylylsulfate kinase